MKRFALAVSFLTVIPVRLKEPPHPGDLGKPPVGFRDRRAHGRPGCGGLFYGLSLILPHLLAAALAVALWIALTGGLHLDGLADCCDGMLHASAGNAAWRS